MATYTVGTVGTHDYDGITGAGGVNAATFSSGDLVLFNRGETFTGQLTCDQSGVTYGATGTGADPVLDANDVADAITVTQPCTIQDLNIINPGVNSRCVTVNLTGTCTIQRCTLNGSRDGRGILLNTSGDLVVDQCDISETNDGLYLNGTSATITNTNITNGDNDGIYSLGTTTVVCTNVNISGYAQSGFKLNSSGTHVLTNCTANENLIDGFQQNLTANVTCIGCTANSNGSAASGSGDGFTGHSTGVLNMYGCSASKNFKSGVKVVESCSGEIYNCSFYDNYEDTNATDNFGMSFDNTAGNWTVKNNVTQGHRIEIQVSAGAVAGTGVFTIDNNIYNNTRTVNAYDWGGSAGDITAWNTATGGTDIEADPLFVNAESLVLNVSEGSPCIAAGVKWWTGANPVGADGEPFSDIDTDIGCIQSKSSPFHPARL